MNRPARIAAGTVSAPTAESERHIRTAAPPSDTEVVPYYDRGQMEVVSPLLDADRVALLKRIMMAQNVTDDEFRVFVAVCERTKLDPLARQIYAIKRYNQQSRKEEMTIVTGIDGYRLIAERSRHYDGQEGPWWLDADGQWTDVWTDANPPRAARVKVYRRGWPRPVTATVRYESYAAFKQDQQGNLIPIAQWARMPEHMLGKCAEALALRKAFPQDLSGVLVEDELSAEAPSGTVIGLREDRAEGPGAAAITGHQQRQVPAAVTGPPIDHGTSQYVTVMRKPELIAPFWARVQEDLGMDEAGAIALLGVERLAAFPYGAMSLSALYEAIKEKAAERSRQTVDRVEVQQDAAATAQPHSNEVAKPEPTASFPPDVLVRDATPDQWQAWAQAVMDRDFTLDGFDAIKEKLSVPPAMSLGDAYGETPMGDFLDIVAPA